MNGTDIEPLDRQDVRALVVDLAEAAYTGRVCRFNELRTNAPIDDMEWEFSVCRLLGRLLAERAVHDGVPAVDAWPRARLSLS